MFKPVCLFLLFYLCSCGYCINEGVTDDNNIPQNATDVIKHIQSLINQNDDSSKISSSDELLWFSKMSTEVQNDTDIIIHLEFPIHQSDDTMNDDEMLDIFEKTFSVVEKETNIVLRLVFPTNQTNSPIDENEIPDNPTKMSSESQSRMDIVVRLEFQNNTTSQDETMDILTKMFSKIRIGGGKTGGGFKTKIGGGGITKTKTGGGIRGRNYYIRPYVGTGKGGIENPTALWVLLGLGIAGAMGYVLCVILRAHNEKSTYSVKS